MSDKCHICQSAKITYYRQIRVDGVAVVTARCENGHIPIKNKPFYPVYLFHIDELPLLPSQKNDPIAQQVEMFKVQEREVKQIWEQPIKKYPPMPRQKSTGINFPYPVEDK